MINYLRSQGLDDKTISVIVVMFAGFLILFGICILGIYTYDTLRNMTPPPLVGYVLGGIGIMGVNLISGHFTARTIDGSNAKIADVMTQRIIDNQQNKIVQENTLATLQNTQAVQQSSAEAHESK